LILSDIEIKEALKNQQIIINPTPKDSQFTTSAVDLMLGDELNEPEEPLKGTELQINPAEVDLLDLLTKYTKPVQPQQDGSFILNPEQFVLGITNEYIELPIKSRIAARVEGRSSLARLGLVVHLTAPTIHAGFKGRIALEMYNFGKYPIKLVPMKLAICQLIFERLGRTPKREPPTKFMGQTKLTRK
jgi:dCTP deaminase